MYPAWFVSTDFEKTRFRDYLLADFPTKNAEHGCGLVAV